MASILQNTNVKFNFITLSTAQAEMLNDISMEGLENSFVMTYTADAGNGLYDLYFCDSNGVINGIDARTNITTGYNSIFAYATDITAYFTEVCDSLRNQTLELNAYMLDAYSYTLTAALTTAPEYTDSIYQTVRGLITTSYDSLYGVLQDHQYQINSNYQDLYSQIQVVRSLVGGGSSGGGGTEGVDVDAINEAIAASVASATQSLQKQVENLKKNTAPIGSVVAWAGRNIPDGWLMCDGEEYSSIDYPDLSNMLGGTTRFTVPDLRNRFIMGAESNSKLGETGGSASTTLVIDNLPYHQHTVTDRFHVSSQEPDRTDVAVISETFHSGGAGTDMTTEYVWVKDEHTRGIDEWQGTEPIDNRPPYYSLIYIIKAEYYQEN